MAAALTAAAAAAPANKSTRVQEPNNVKQTQVVQTQPQKPVASKPMTQVQPQPKKSITAKPVTAKPMKKVVIPPPPPGVPEIQLRMWSKTLRVRMNQLKQLSTEHHHLSGLANEIRKDFMTFRYGKNEYSAALAHVRRKSRESNRGGNNSSSGGDDDDADLAAGRYSSLYLQQDIISPESIGRHFLALFYCSIDNRLPPAMNKYGLDALRRAFASLDSWRKKLEEEKSRKRKRSVDEENDNIGSDVRTARKEDGLPAKGKEQVRQDPVEPASKRANVTTELPRAPTGTVAASNDEQLDQQKGSSVANTSGNADVVMEDPSSLFQTALRQGFSAVFLRGKTDVELRALLSSSGTASDKTTHHASLSSEAKETTENVSKSINSSTDTDQPLQFQVSATEDISPPVVNVPVVAAAVNNTELVDKEMRKDPPKKDSKMAATEDTSPPVVHIPVAMVLKELVNKEMQKDPPKKDSDVVALNPNSTQSAKPRHGAQLEIGAPSNHEAGDSGNKEMTGVSSEAKEREGNATTLVFSDAGQPEIRFVSNDIGDASVAVGNSSALNSLDNKNDKINAANDSTSSIPVGYRRRTLKKCHLDDCPNKGGKCTLHGTLARTCTVEGCDNFHLQGFSVCMRHGAKPAGRKEGKDASNGSLPNSQSSDSLSNAPPGYRRRSVKKCHIDDCPNKGGRCNLHGKLGKTCKVEGCNTFQVQGFDVCIKHGAKNPNLCKVDGCAKLSIRYALCVDHLPELANTKKHSSGVQAANESQAATKAAAEPRLPATNQPHASSANAPAEPQLVAKNPSQASSSNMPAEPQVSATNESQASSAKVPPLNHEIPSINAPSLKRESSNGLPSSKSTGAMQAETNPTSNGEGDGGDTHQNNNVDELIDLTEDSPSKEAPPEPRISSPPPSPPPTTIIRNPLPPTKPRPLPFSDFHRTLFCPDLVTERGTISGCVKNYSRPEMLVEFDRGYHLDGSGGSLDNAHCTDVQNRLNTWDPYWKIVQELGSRDVSCEDGITSVGTRTTACLPVTTNPIASTSIPSCAMVSIDFRQEISKSTSANRDGKGRSVQGFRPWGVRWGKAPPDSHQLGDRRLIMRCVPLHRTPKEEKKRADMHLWPLGSFVQIKFASGCDQVIPVIQRKQQSHDHSKWLGNCRPLDLTKYVTGSGTDYPLEITICTKEVIESGFEKRREVLINSYAVNVAICEYTPPDDLYNQLMGKAEGGEVLMPKLSLRSAKRMLKECIVNNTISLDSDEEEGDGKDSESDFLTFSLLCHASMTKIETPVRGQLCTHLQCFDLRNYLYTNNIVSAGRWRCPYCEKFVSVRDLVHCGLFQAILDDLDDKIVPGVRDNVCVKADGTWQLLGENKLRHKKSSSKAEAGASAAMNIEEVIGSESDSGPEEIEVEVIEIG